MKKNNLYRWVCIFTLSVAVACVCAEEVCAENYQIGVLIKIGDLYYLRDDVNGQTLLVTSAGINLERYLGRDIAAINGLFKYLLGAFIVRPESQAPYVRDVVNRHLLYREAEQGGNRNLDELRGERIQIAETDELDLLESALMSQLREYEDTLQGGNSRFHSVIGMVRQDAEGGYYMVTVWRGGPRIMETAVRYNVLGDSALLEGLTDKVVIMDGKVSLLSTGEGRIVPVRVRELVFAKNAFEATVYGKGLTDVELPNKASQAKVSFLLQRQTETLEDALRAEAAAYEQALYAGELPVHAIVGIVKRNEDGAFYISTRWRGGPRIRETEIRYDVTGATELLEKLYNSLVIAEGAIELETWSKGVINVSAVTKLDFGRDAFETMVYGKGLTDKELPNKASHARHAYLVAKQKESIQKIDISYQDKIIAQVREDLAYLLNVDVDQIGVETVQMEWWTDSSLGYPEPGMLYAQVMTPGYRIILTYNGESYEYHTDMNGNFKLDPAAENRDRLEALAMIEKLLANYEADPIDVNGSGAVNSGDMLMIRTLFTLVDQYRNYMDPAILVKLDLDQNGKLDEYDMHLAYIRVRHNIGKPASERVDPLQFILGFVHDPLDVNGDGKIDSEDQEWAKFAYQLIIQYQHLLSPDLLAAFDVNSDGVVDKKDLEIAIRNIQSPGEAAREHLANERGVSIDEITVIYCEETDWKGFGPEFVEMPLMGHIGDLEEIDREKDIADLILVPFPGPLHQIRVFIVALADENGERHYYKIMMDGEHYADSPVKWSVYSVDKIQKDSAEYAELNARAWIAAQSGVDELCYKIIGSGAPYEPPVPPNLVYMRVGVDFLLVTLEREGERFYIRTTRVIHPDAAWEQCVLVEKNSAEYAMYETRRWLFDQIEEGNIGAFSTVRPLVWNEFDISILYSEWTIQNDGYTEMRVAFEYNGKRHYVKTGIETYPGAEWGNHTYIDPAGYEAGALASREWLTEQANKGMIDSEFGEDVLRLPGYIETDFEIIAINNITPEGLVGVEYLEIVFKYGDRIITVYTNRPVTPSGEWGGFKYVKTTADLEEDRALLAEPDQSGEPQTEDTGIVTQGAYEFFLRQEVEQTINQDKELFLPPDERQEIKYLNWQDAK